MVEKNENGKLLLDSLDLFYLSAYLQWVIYVALCETQRFHRNISQKYVIGCKKWRRRIRKKTGISAAVVIYFPADQTNILQKSWSAVSNWIYDICRICVYAGRYSKKVVLSADIFAFFFFPLAALCLTILWQTRTTFCIQTARTY